jgi:hypothetical protein
MIPGTLSHLELMWATPANQHLLKRLTAFARVILFDKRGLPDARYAEIPGIDHYVADSATQDFIANTIEQFRHGGA